MASLTIRNLPDEVKLRLRQRAAANGRSMEEEGRRVIQAAVTPPMAECKSIGRMLYEGSRPGVELPEVPDTPASFATFDDE